MKRVKMVCCLVWMTATLAHGYAQAQQPAPLNKADSAAALLQKEVNGGKSRLAAPLKQIGIPASDSALHKKLAATAKGDVNDMLTAAKAPLQQLMGGVRLFEGAKPVTFNQLSVTAEYSYFQDTSGMGLGEFNNLQGTVGYNIAYGVSLESMPFNMNVMENNGINTLNYTPFQNFYKFNFDHAQYLQTLRAKVMEKINPEAITNSALGRVASIRRNYEQQLEGELGQMQGEFTKEYKSTVPIPANSTNLSATDMGALRNQMLPGTALQQYNKDMASLQQMLRTRDQKSLATDSNYNKTLANVKRYETLEKMYKKITGWQQRYQSNPVIKTLLGQSSFSPDNMKAYLSDPQNLGKVLDDQASLSALQKIFYNVKTLDLGQNAVQSGELSTQNVVNTGINTEYQSKATSFGMIYGKNNNSNNWLQAGLTSQVTNQYSNLTGFKFGTGSGSPIDQSVAFNFFNMNTPSGPASQPGAVSSYMPVAPHQDGVISLHSGFQLGNQHMISVDLSKSFGSFQQNVTGDSSNNKSIAGGSVFNNSGKSNYAGILTYTGEILQTNVKLYAKKVGLGYNNPGNALLRTGETQIGLGLARKFMGQRLALKYEGDYRSQVFDPSGNYVYTSLTNKLQAGFKIDRNDRISLIYQRSDYHTSFYGQAPSNGTNSLLQLNGSYRFTVNKKKIMNNLTISRQQMSLPLTTGGVYSMTNLLLTNTSSMMLKKNLLSLTLLTNQSDNSTYYFNTSMSSAETNYSYTLAGNLRLSSGLGYYVNYGWNQQVGIKQQISAMINGKLNLDLQIAYKKAVQIIRPELADQLYFGTTMRYTFK